jgi:hypothetical protein
MSVWGSFPDPLRRHTATFAQRSCVLYRLPLAAEIVEQRGS